MSITLGEKLRQAREERGISISEVAEQTRISPLYIKSIEEDDYRTLPGGIFNKGFVKSYAKYVGIDEQEALQDYGALAGSQNIQRAEDTKTYRSEVLTDDHASKSNLPTIVFAVVILGFMTFGILWLVNYLQNRQTDTTAVNANISANTNADSPNPATIANANTSTVSVPSMNDLNVEVRAVNAPVSVSSTSDGTRASRLMTPEKPLSFQPKEALKIGYARSLAQNVQMTINGKQISLPTTPANPGRSVIEFEITKDNLPSIWQNGKISFDAAANAPR
ncbi:MAG TPA: helix-turn-helix domain-containing protein [Pyrinomonadaceae bacterium]|nr:helix-turn-helix domain-containing protein [Pyrinomonadaceae bacterium]